MVSASATFTGPEYYNNLLGPILFEPFAAGLIQRLPQRPPGDVLEIACGTGIVTKRLRERIDPALRLVATDLSKAMLDFARTKLDDCKGIEWREADALKLPFASNTFGAVVCGFGVMFMPDRQAMLKEARRVLVKGGILLFNVWDRIEENPAAAVNAAAIEAMFPGDADLQLTIPYDMYDPAHLRQLLAAANFGEARIETDRVTAAGVDPLALATGQFRGTPRGTLMEKRGISLDHVINKVAEALAKAGGNPYYGHSQAVVVQALAL